MTNFTQWHMMWAMPLRLALLLFLAAVILCAQQSAAPPAAEPFEMLWNVDGPYQADASFLLEAPAGKHGFVKVLNGRLADGQGNASHLGRQLLLHHLVPRQKGCPAVAPTSPASGQLRPRPSSRLAHPAASSTRRTPTHAPQPDMVTASTSRLELKKRGIYVVSNLNVARAFQPGDGVKDTGQRLRKAVTLFDPRIIELEKEFAHAYPPQESIHRTNTQRAAVPWPNW